MYLEGPRALVPWFEPATRAMNEQPKTPPTGDDASKRPPSPGPMAQNAAERLAIIIDAVEHAAAGVIDDAEAQAKQHLEQAKSRADRIAEERIRAITELTDGLIQQAEEVKSQADKMIAALEDANLDLGGGSGAEGAEQPAPEPPAPAEPAEPGEPPTPTEEAGGTRPQLSHLKPVSPPRQGGTRPQQLPRSVGTRLLVTQMAISGSSRGEIEARLRNELGVKDTSQVVDAILGPED